MKTILSQLSWESYKYRIYSRFIVGQELKTVVIPSFAKLKRLKFTRFAEY